MIVCEGGRAWRSYTRCEGRLRDGAALRAGAPYNAMITLFHLHFFATGAFDQGQMLSHGQ